MQLQHSYSHNQIIYLPGIGVEGCLESEFESRRNLILATDFSEEVIVGVPLLGKGQACEGRVNCH